MSDLFSLGWSEFFQAQIKGDDATGVPGRVSAEYQTDYELMTEAGGVVTPAPLKGPRPTVGDWVLLDPTSTQIVRRLDRKSSFVRARSGGGRAKAQVLAVNVDVLFIVTSADGNLSPRRLERYLTAAWDGGVIPVAVLNKIDLVEDPEPLLRTLRCVSPGVEVVGTSALARRQTALRRYLGPGKTCALVGSSGVGKSTLANQLLGSDGDRLATAAVREGDGKGRHTTTGRSLHRVPGNGGLVLDTPGMREFAMWFDHADGLASGRPAGIDGLDQAFPDVAGLIGQCRFRDCRHEAEPGCALRGAVEDGTVAAGRVNSYLKLGEERATVRQLKGAAERTANRGRAKALAREIRYRKRVKGR